jgi:Zn-finger nucleic acid-binding protein
MRRFYNATVSGWYARAMQCPRCDIALAERAAGVNACAKCGGAWIGAALADAVDVLVSAGVDDVAAGAATPDVRAVGPCPVCAAPMKKHRFGLSLEVDSCAHGTWLDRGEIPRLRDAVTRGVDAIEVVRDAGVDAKGAPVPPKPRTALTDEELLALERKANALLAMDAIALQKERARMAQRSTDLSLRARRSPIGALAGEAVKGGLHWLLFG